QNRAAVDRGVLAEQEPALVLRHGDLRTLLDLTFSRFAAHLPDQLADLQQAGGADRVAARAEPAARVDRLAAVERRDMVVDQLRSLAGRAEAEALVEHELGRRHGIMQLDRVEIFGADAGFLIGGLRAGRRRVRARVVGQAVDAGLQYAACD